MLGVLGAIATLPSTGFMLLDLWANSKAGATPATFAHALDRVRALPLAVVVLSAVLLLADVGWMLGSPPTPTADGSGIPLRLSRGGWYLGTLLTAGYAAVRLRWFWWPLWDVAGAPSDVRERWVGWASSTFHGAPLMGYLWMLALAAIATHLGRALTRRLSERGPTVSPSGNRLARALGATVAVAMFLYGGGSVLLLATGWRPLVAASSEPVGACRDGASPPAPSGSASAPDSPR